MKTVGKISILILLLVVGNSYSLLNGQVTMGSGNQPQDYAILQIDGVGGLRLPKLTRVQRANVESTLDEDAKGLVIYFDDDQGDDSSFQFWNGTEWVPLKYMNELYNAQNGITDTKEDLGNDIVKQTFELGGTLIEETTIKQPAAKLLRFNPSGGTFTVMRNALVVTDDGVGIGKTPSNALLDITGTRGKAFRYDTPDAQANLILASDAYGNATWRSMKPNAELKSGTIKNNTTIAQTSNTFVPITDPLNLTPGVWLIIARYVAIATSVTTSQWGYNAWLSLRKEGNETDDITCIGQVPQLMSTTATATPQLAYILNVKEAANYYLYANVKCSNVSQYSMKITTSESSTTGVSYFNAVRLSEDPAN